MGIDLNFYSREFAGFQLVIYNEKIRMKIKTKYSVTLKTQAPEYFVQSFNVPVLPRQPIKYLKSYHNSKVNCENFVECSCSSDVYSPKRSHILHLLLFSVDLWSCKLKKKFLNRSYNSILEKQPNRAAVILDFVWPFI